MRVVATGIEGLVVIEPRVFEDERGFFVETFSERAFGEAGLPTRFVQDNWSRSRKNVLRGLHWQDPNGQGKLVRAANGCVWDVAVDIRRGSATFGQWFGVELSSDNKKALYIPAGFAHGFVALSEDADFHYKCTSLYSPKDEKGLRWNDPDLKIAWPVQDPLVSPKDGVHPTFAQLFK